MTRGQKILLYSSAGIIGLYFLFLGLIEAKGLLAPLLTAVVLSLVTLPLSNRLERKMNRSISSLISVFVLFLVSLGFLTLISFQIQNFVDSWPKIEEAMEPKVEQVKAFVLEYTLFSEEDLSTTDEESKKMIEGNVEDAGKQVFTIFTGILFFLGNFLLTIIYTFFLLNYRTHFKKFILKLFSVTKSSEVNKVIHKVGNVAQQYLFGKLILILILAVLYSVGFGISGVDNFILVSMIAALLTLVPILGNAIGVTIAIVFGYLTTGDINVLIGIIITYSAAQFVESYVLEPFIIGDKLDLHPFIIILSIIIGGSVWGITGMILAIPITGILGLIFLQIRILHPLGYLFSKDDDGVD
ncbi:AI-2E family transporter [Psychroflexus montanilacus]|uniref:AI-2E family transporter n=1 Tax=Psychroflexus montanilacus TaxID=2873598 RepID=UPI001CD01E8C|nr:AI-2E family transporter [Psychroflexus montanilacus]MBZ9651425.1 AI-2E family transporter [Psychroflexus montanilacus]